MYRRDEGNEKMGRMEDEEDKEKKRRRGGGDGELLRGWGRGRSERWWVRDKRTKKDKAILGMDDFAVPLSFIIIAISSSPFLGLSAKLDWGLAQEPNLEGVLPPYLIIVDTLLWPGTEAIRSANHN